MFTSVSSSEYLAKTFSKAFARRRARRPAKAWLATLPLIAVTALTFNGPAPAEMSSGTPIETIVRQEGRWSIDNARTLASLIEESAQEGLEPSDYRLAELKSALEAGEPGAALDMLASSSALMLAHDYADGRIEDKQAFDWHMTQPADPNLLQRGLDDALAQGKLRTWMQGLLPDNAQYRALKAAYAATGPADSARRELLRANLERWRWMPRNLGERYIYVNVPSYRLELINAGVEEASFNVVVGAPKTPTPQLALQAQSVVANPSWTLPPSVLKEGRWQGKGYSVTRRADGSLNVRQAPGPRNALGRIKIDMPNSHAIYLHDTPQKAAFERTDRALSHGCVRVQNIEELAALLHGGVELDDALADPAKTKVLQLQKSVPVYIAYFTAEAQPDGTIRYLGDPYQRDQALLERIGAQGGSPIRMAAR
ncbi:hypothetical protein ASE00_14025 [Sphingomonas sp. Root710]|uniref:L,D-transpeptidase family protein n=1 Tax=Sphingomonas sp. Root710 TaxID=1736594 RepID=UPI0006F896EA|nr:L,D-transpeptidase family protein [Sphingomonas sp. Root710]KRB81129.1 hypothetical protein ASE00_14025 [Sphingomonas sp. Root710]